MKKSQSILIRIGYAPYGVTLTTDTGRLIARSEDHPDFYIVRLDNAAHYYDYVTGQEEKLMELTIHKSHLRKLKE
jgi:hypothetical protein